MATFWPTEKKVPAQTGGFGRLLAETSEESPNLFSMFGKLLKETPVAIIAQAQTAVAAVEKRVLGVATEKKGPESLTVAMLGDSMVDVLWEELPQLRSALSKYFPNTNLKLYNFGVGASDLEYAFYRLTNEYDYLGRHYPSVLSVNPDVLVIESFAYNNFGDTKEGLDKQWMLLGELTGKVKELSPKTKIILAATIAPNSLLYGEGIGGINWEQWEKTSRTQAVRKYLENLINFATSQNFPLADAYHASLDSNGEGNLVYINAGDHLHPSGPGGELFCGKVAEVIRNIF